LLGETIVQGIDQIAHVVGHVAEVEVLALAVSGVEDFVEVLEDVDDLGVAGEWRVAEVVDTAAFLVSADDSVDEGRQGFLEA
jgi:Asp-tRNA(Asn)/Glu-tRNA(Gln) amidotransferase C subunit